MSITLNGTSGITAPRVDSAAGVGNIPAFFTTFTGTAVPATTPTELGLNSKSFDTSGFVNTTTGRFTPSVAGYYQFNAAMNQGAASIGGMSIDIRKNGVSTGISFSVTTSTTGPYQALAVSGMVYLNGSTDYVSVFAYNAGGSGTGVGTFSGFLARAA